MLPIALCYPLFSGLTLPHSERDIVEKARDMLRKIPTGGGIPQRFMVVTLISIERIDFIDFAVLSKA